MHHLGQTSFKELRTPVRSETLTEVYEVTDKVIVLSESGRTHFSVGYAFRVASRFSSLIK